MAIFYPANLEEHAFHSKSERTVYRAMKKKLSDDFIVIYSLTRTNEKNISYECDFVVLHKTYGFAALEVKGGIVSFDEKNAFSKNRSTNSIYTVKNPAEQAKNSMFAIMHEYLRQTKRKFPLKYTWGVILPDSIFNSSNKDLNCVNTLDSRRLDEIDTWIVELFERTIGYKEQNCCMNQQDIDIFLSIFTDELKVAYSITSNIIYQKEKFDELNKFQNYLIDLFEDKPRIAFEGAAGTGKTFIAMKKIDSLLAGGRSVLFLCFNKKLKEFVYSNFIDQKNIKFATFHSLAEEIITKYILHILKDKNETTEFLEFLKKILVDVKEINHQTIRKLINWALKRLRSRETLRELLDNCHKIPYLIYEVLDGLYLNYDEKADFNTEYYDLRLPIVLLEIFEKDFEIDTFDAIIIDEAQDFKKEWCDCINYFFERERSRIIYIFYDENQNIFRKNRDLPIINLISKRNLNHLVFKLKHNLRNTKDIYNFAIDQSGIGKTAYSPELKGCKPENSSFTSDKECRKYIAGILHDLVNIQKIENNRIIILSNRSIDNSVFDTCKTAGNFIINENGTCCKSVDIQYSTIQKFKGLEMDIVILLWHNRAQDNIQDYHVSDELKYIGITRAKYMLFWVEIKE